MTITGVDHTPEVLTVRWQDGAATRFHAIWLRDNAQGAAFRHPGNDQRLFDLTEMPDDIEIADARAVPDGVEIRFAPDGAVSVFAAAYLREHAYDRAVATPDQPVWGADLGRRLTRHAYDVVRQNPSARKAWLDDVTADGIALLTGVPAVEGKVCEVAELFGFVRETNYGRLFEVRSEAQPINLAYTPVGLNVHTDNPYRSPVPGLQLLHCLTNAAEGGDSVFVDGFRCAQKLRAEAPDAFALLSRHRAPFRYRNAETDLSNRTAYIETDETGRIAAIRYNNRSAAPLDLPFEVMGEFYAALRRFSRLLHDRDGEMRLRLEPGDLVTFDNERVLHGRTGFSGGARHLQGCYADKDSLRSMAAVLSRKSA